MKLTVLAAAAAFGAIAFGGTAHAQSETRQALARTVLERMELEEVIGDMFETMSPMMAAGAARELDLSASEEARLGELFAEEFRGQAAQMVGQMADVYAARLEESQLRDVADFLASPSGQAWMRTQEETEQEIERMGQVAGMEVALRAMTRLSAERAPAQAPTK